MQASLLQCSVSPQAVTDISGDETNTNPPATNAQNHYGHGVALTLSTDLNRSPCSYGSKLQARL